jgi:hypothetical protein
MPSTGAPDPSARAPCLLCSYGLAAAEPPEPSMPGCRAHSMLTTRASPCARRRALSVMPSLTRVIACTLRSSSESIHAPPGVQRELTYISLVVLPACSRPPSSRLAFESPGRRVAWPSSRLSSCRLVASLCQGQVTSATSSLKSITSSQASKVNQVMSSQA